tara:strand:- start:334 stop:606 length:273 start_codon:yes stop_codon:yes gene_type:complete
MKKATVEWVIKDFIHRRLQYNNNEISSHHFEVDIPLWGSRYWDVRHNPSTYSRAWRKLKGSDELSDIGIEKVKIKDTKSRERTWILIRNT